MEHKYLSHNECKYDIQIANDLFECRIFWARVISSENESLFTQYTKHTFYEMQYALEGSISMTLGKGERILVPKGEFIIITPDTYHQIADGDSEGARFIMAFDIRFREKAPGSLHGALNTLKSHRESSAMRPLLSMILEKDYRDNVLRRAGLGSLIESFLFEIFESVADKAETVETVGYDRQSDIQVKKILGYIHEFNGIGITVSGIAQHFHLSERHLGRILQASTGKTARDHMHHEKIKYIEILSLTTSLSLSEIAELCGFSDEYAMNKFFRRHTKTNLSDFRRIARREKSRK